MVQKIEKIKLPTNWPVGPVNVYLVYGEKLTLIDTGLNYNESWSELNASLHKLGLKLNDIEQIVLTHHHNDHVGLLEKILEVHPVPVYAHKLTKIFLEDEEYLKWSGEFFVKLFYEFGLPMEMSKKWAFRKRDRRIMHELKIEKTLEDGDLIPGLNKWKAIETLGHSQDHISLYCEGDKSFICGDNIIKGLHVGIFLDAPLVGQERAKPLIQFLDNLEKCGKLNVKKTYSGHGPDIDNLTEAIDWQIDNIENRVQRAINTLKKANRPCTGFEIIQNMYKGRYENAAIPFLFEIQSVLDLLQERKVIIAEKKNGVYQYSLKNK